MQLITLNIWGGHVLEPLLAFVKAHQDIDIFCFQEVYHHAANRISDEDRPVCLDIFSKLEALLPEHRGFFRSVVDTIYGIGIFIKKDIDVIEEGEIVIHHNPSYRGRGPTHSRNLQWLTYRYHDKTYSILNVHGLWNGMGKADSPERLLQSRRIRTFMDSLQSLTILCGDFNLRPDTLSMEILEQGMNNLIKTNNITSTRTNFYTKDEKFADYILTSPEIIIDRFNVLTDVVSDHSPLLLEFS